MPARRKRRRGVLPLSRQQRCPRLLRVHNSPSVEADGYFIVGDPAFGPNVDVRCRIDPGGYMNNAVGTVYSSLEPANLQEALVLCGNVGGYGP